MFKYIKSLSILFTVVLLFSVISGCAAEIPRERDTQEKHNVIDLNFESVTHMRSQVSQRMYEALSASYNGVSYEIESACVETQAEAKEIVRSISTEINKVTDFVEGFNVTPPTILVVTKDIIDGKDLIHSYHYDSTVITTIEHINSKEYLHALIGAMLDSNIHWINYGLAGQFSNSSINDNEIRTYLSIENNIKVLDFFGGRYYETVAGNDTDNTILVTQAFVDYYITTYGKDAFLSYIRSESMPDLVKEKNEWLGALGLEQDYADEHKIAFQSFEFSHYPNCDFQISSPYAVYKINMNTDEYVLSSLEKLKYFLTKNILAMQEVKAFLSNRISDKDLIELYMIPLYDINEAVYQTVLYGNPYDNIIKIHAHSLEKAHIHEYVHVITPINEDDMLDEHIDEEYDYFVEGIACYVTSSVNNEYSCNYTDFDTYNTFNEYKVWTEIIYIYEPDNISSCDVRYQFYVNKYLEYYTSHAKDFINFTDFSMKLYSDSVSYALLELQGKYPSIKLEDFDYYALYESFVGYLADEYSLEHVLQTLKDYDNIETIFGKSFSELHSEWKEYLYKS